MRKTYEFIPPETKDIEEFKKSFGEKHIERDVESTGFEPATHKEEDSQNKSVMKSGFYACKILIIGFIGGFLVTSSLLVLYFTLRSK